MGSSYSTEHRAKQAEASYEIAQPIFLSSNQTGQSAPAYRQSAARLSAYTPARPKKSDKTAEEYAKAITAYHAAYRTHIAHNAAIQRKRVYQRESGAIAGLSECLTLPAL